jgi:hypothetical protein
VRRAVSLFLLCAVFAALLPTAALGKGASEATIAGPGLDRPITLAREGQVDGEALMRIAEAAGFYPGVFQQTPDPMLDARPRAELGPMYTIEYVMPGPRNEQDTLVQELYPYATPTPITYVSGGQPFWSSEVTRGGWFVAGTTLKRLLVDAGLPATAPPIVESPSDSTRRVLAPIGVLIALAAAAGLAVAITRSRVRTA